MVMPVSRESRRFAHTELALEGQWRYQDSLCITQKLLILHIYCITFLFSVWY